ncbi:hypothetical protein [Hyphobacterium sp.]|uniref:hypothetical protein n=1 Tax=Hyphobacterium sp. TaxID=2004662 RepID=UPI0037481912
MSEPGQEGFLPLEVKALAVFKLDYRLLGVGLFLISLGSFIGIAVLTHINGLEGLLPGGSLAQEFEIALVFSALLALAICLQTTGHNLWQRELPSLKRAIRTGLHDRLAPFATGLPIEWEKPYRSASLVGFVLGIAMNGAIILQSEHPVRIMTDPIGIWFFVMGPLLLTLGARGLVDMSHQSRFLKDLIENGAVIDLTDLENLQVFGRMGLHEALSWSLIAVILIPVLVMGFSTGGIGVVGTGIVAITLALGGAVRSFWLAIQPVQTRISLVKADKIRLLRAEIIKAPANVGDLISLENWVSARPEWPISAPISRRLAVYVALPLLAWAGAALVDRGVSALIT